MHNDVPRYLRTEGQIANRRMGRKEMEELIMGFWEYRSMKMTSGEDEMQSMDALLYDYLLSRNDGKEDKAFEDGYNLDECCSRFLHLSHVSIFMKILTGDIEEEVYNGWISTQVTLMQRLKATIESQGTLSIALLEGGIREVLPYKEESSISTLLQCAMRIAKEEGDNVNIIKLMDRGAMKEPSEFVLLLLEQRREESRQYASDLSKLLESKELVSPDEVMKAMKEYDSIKEDSEMQLLMSKLFQVPLGQVRSDEPNIVKLPKEDLVRKLEATNIVKSTLK